MENESSKLAGRLTGGWPKRESVEQATTLAGKKLITIETVKYCILIAKVFQEYILAQSRETPDQYGQGRSSATAL